MTAPDYTRDVVLAAVDPTVPLGQALAAAAEQAAAAAQVRGRVVAGAPIAIPVSMCTPGVVPDTVPSSDIAIVFPTRPKDDD